MSKMDKVRELGQSIWLDYIERDFVRSGDLQALIDEGLGGLTSNPTIFEKALQGTAYDQDIKALIKKQMSSEKIFEELAIKDIQDAADLFFPVYDKTKGTDGLVSFEVNPNLAHNTQKTIKEAERLWAKIDRPNVMIKVPATEEGYPAITELIGQGINVNVTLIFSLESYKKVTRAFRDGLERMDRNGLPLHKVASVASFFVSRVDSKVDALLEKAGNQDLQGKIAIANSKAAYTIFQDVFDNKEWEMLENKGARVQRVLWASTSTKSDAYPDTLYVDNLIGPHTVNTLPPDTLEKFNDHGKVNMTLSQDTLQAEKQLQKLDSLGISMEQVTDELLREGVQKFADSYESLMQALEEKRESMAKEVTGA